MCKKQFSSIKICTLLHPGVDNSCRVGLRLIRRAESAFILRIFCVFFCLSCFETYDAFDSSMVNTYASICYTKIKRYEGWLHWTFWANSVVIPSEFCRNSDRTLSVQPPLSSFCPSSMGISFFILRYVTKGGCTLSVLSDFCRNSSEFCRNSDRTLSVQPSLNRLFAQVLWNFFFYTLRYVTKGGCTLSVLSEWRVVIRRNFVGIPTERSVYNLP